MRRSPALVIASHRRRTLCSLQLLLGRLAGCAPPLGGGHGIDVWTCGFGLRRWALQRLELVLRLPPTAVVSCNAPASAGAAPSWVVLPELQPRTAFRLAPRPSGLLEPLQPWAEQPLIFIDTRLSSKDCYIAHRRADHAMQSCASSGPISCC